MPSSHSKSPADRKNRKKSGSPEKRKGSRDARSPSSGSSRSSRSSRSRRSADRRSRSQEKRKQYERYPPRRENESVPKGTKLFVTNIDSKVISPHIKFSQEELERDLRGLFEPFGKIKEIIIKTKQGSSNSYCFVQYENIESAEKAQQGLKGRDFKGKELKVQFGRGERKNQDRKSDKCYICHRQGHFAKDCRYNRYTGSADVSRRRDVRDSRDRDRDRDRDRRDRDRDGDRRHRRHDSRSRSSSESRSYRRRHSDRDRDDYRRRDRDSRRSPQKRDYYSRRH